MRAVVFAVILLACGAAATTCGQAYANGFTCGAGWRTTDTRNAVVCKTSVCASRECCSTPTCASASSGGVFSCPERYILKSQDKLDTIFCSWTTGTDTITCGLPCCTSTCVSAYLGGQYYDGTVCPPGQGPKDNTTCSDNRASECTAPKCCTPTPSPSVAPTEYPTEYPTATPSASPSLPPTENPTEYPSAAPTFQPTEFVPSTCADYTCVNPYVAKASPVPSSILCGTTGCSNQKCCDYTANTCLNAFNSGFKCPIAFRQNGLVSTVQCPNHICTQGTCCLPPTCATTFNATSLGLLPTAAQLTCPAGYVQKPTASITQCRLNAENNEPRCQYQYCCDATCASAGIVCPTGTSPISNFDTQRCSDNIPSHCTNSSCCV